MKLFQLARVSALCLPLGLSAMLCAQDQRDEAKPPEHPQDQARPQEEHPDTARRPEDKMAQPDKENKGAKQDSKDEKQSEHNGQAGQDQRKVAGQRGGHIPDDKFRAHFGRQHTFVVSRPTVVEGQPRFQYGGYNFVIVDAWPVGWAYTDQCYIDFIDGEYFLFDVLHPGVQVALFVVL